MKLAQVLHDIIVIGNYPQDVEVSSVELNSNKVVAGSLFIALSGVKTDGKKYIPDAIARGAVAIVYSGEYTPPAQDENVAFIQVGGDMRINTAKIAANFYTTMPRLISAVTGTNGKTSIADFTRQMMTDLGHSSASIGTIGVVSDVMENFETLTTPDTITLHQILTKLAENKVEYVSMEASSIGIEQHRMDGLHISVAGFTNFTQDHLDYHGSMEAYFKAKEILFSELMSENGTAVLNADIPEYGRLAEVCKKRGINIISYGYAGEDLKLISRTPHAEGQGLEVEVLGKKYDIELPLIGEFQTMNVLCAMGMVIALNGFDEKIINYIPKIKGASGRLDLAGKLPNGAAVYVDYAHTPDALENVLKTMRCHTENKLWVIFGCGGDRDKAKRPIMGKIAHDLADEIVLTDDNPRSEDGEQIRREIIVECPEAANIGDRIEAINYAISRLETGDMLVIAGKGHEDGQIIGDTIIPMNDIEEAKKAMKKLV